MIINVDEWAVVPLAMVLSDLKRSIGVWRISTLNKAEGWKDRTTIEYMDLAVRPSLRGLKSVYIGDLKRWIFRVENASVFLFLSSKILINLIQNLTAPYS
ncbi:hypothetical protein LguiA_012537 [Lonicera macranthoides]